MLIRDEKGSDRDVIRALNESAFDTDAEGRLVDALREQARPLVSLVAEQGGSIVAISCSLP